jgi:hypothetical protein
MSQAQASSIALALGVCQLKGRVASRRVINTKNGRQVISTVKLPAPDSFTSPQTVELRSAKSLGEVGEDITVAVKVGGYGRSYQTTDPETGERRNVQTADNTLTVQE